MPSVKYVCGGIGCDTGGIETDSKRELREHHREHHTLTCRHGRPAAYAYNPGAPGSYFYCAEGADRAWDENDTFRRKVRAITRAANDHADRLPEDHPVERKLAKRGDA